MLHILICRAGDPMSQIHAKKAGDINHPPSPSKIFDPKRPTMESMNCWQMGIPIISCNIIHIYILNIYFPQQKLVLHSTVFA